MIDSMIRRPASTAEYAADVVRVLVVGSILAALLFFSPVDVAVFALVLLGCLIARALALAAAVDLATTLMLLVAAWSSVLGIYARIGWWDFVMHAAASGALAGMCYQLVARGAAFAAPPPTAAGRRNPAASYKAATVFLVLACGAALSIFWEFGEWWGHSYIDPAINVGYRDTISDLAAGVMGSLVTGVLIALSRNAPRPPVP
jgi:hypothetical protein